MGKISYGQTIRGKKWRRVMVFIMAMALFVIMQMIAVEDVTAESATGTKVTYKGAISSMGTTCGKFTIKGYDAFCAEHPKTTPPTGTKITSTKLVTNNKMRKALYYGYGGPKAKVSKNNAGWVSTSVALSRANGKGGGTTDAQKFYNKLGDYSIPPDSFKVYICNTAGGLQDLCYWIYEPEGKVRLKKVSADAEATVERGYSLAGAVYGVYTKKACSSGSRVAKLTIGAAGTSNKVTLDKGTYYIKEITAPEGFKLSSTVYTVSITDQCDKTVTVKDSPEKARIQLIKSSAEPEMTEGNAGYSLSGAKYGVWSDKELTKSVGTLTTNSDGRSNELSVLAGTYYIKETLAPKGYLKDDTIYEIKIDIDDLGNVEVLNVKDVPEEDPVWVMIQKIDAVSGEPVPSGNGTLAGAEFTVKYYEGTDWKEDPAKAGAEVKGKWIFRTNENGYIKFDDANQFVSGDELYLNDLGNPTIPIGTVTIQETKAPRGYVRNDEVFVLKILEDDDEPGVSLSQIPTVEVKQQPIRGDIEIIKSDRKTGKRMAGVVFEVIDAQNKNVAAVLKTDENGYATTASGDPTNGSLPYGEYIVREQEPPVGYLPAEDIKVNISENKKTITLSVKNTPAEIGTKAYFEENSSKEILPARSVTIVDEVYYKNLISGKEYRLTGKLMDTETGQPLLIDDSEVTSEIDFIPENSNGVVLMEFMLDASGLSGKSVTVFENLYIGDIPIASHADIADSAQTVKFISVGDIEIYKGDKVTGEPLEGVKFQIIDKLNGEVVAELVTDDLGYATTACEEKVGGSLLLGEYIIRETEPLPGYAPIEDIEVTLDDFNRIMSVKIDNMPLPVPEDQASDTGDHMGRVIPLSIALLIISFMGALVTVRRKEE